MEKGKHSGNKNDERNAARAHTWQTSLGSSGQKGGALKNAVLVNQKLTPRNARRGSAKKGVGQKKEVSGKDRTKNRRQAL